MAQKTKNRKTPEQRREQMEQLPASIGEQVEALRDSQAWEDMLKSMRSFRQYSVGNMLLILSQFPNASQAGVPQLVGRIRLLRLSDPRNHGVLVL